MVSSEHQHIIIEMMSKFNPKMVGIFGSYARKENTRDSDLDILVDFDQTPNLLEIIGLEQELSERLGVQVDLVTLQSLHPLLKEKVQNDLILL